jgi:hypothetical protein
MEAGSVKRKTRWLYERVLNIKREGLRNRRDTLGSRAMVEPKRGT